ncbi:MAG: MarR family transcriptional regulator [Spirochaetales bacterium]|nr:MarR family transcriptional regulator [Spirochaetales bacterium]
MSNYEQLKLENQLCFPIYAASRLVTQLYTPLLKKLDITYPQYLILLVLWEYKSLSVTEIGEKLLLETNTLTPLLQRMEAKGILLRIKSESDERRKIIELTKYGLQMEKIACQIPVELAKSVSKGFSVERAMRLKEDLKLLIESLTRDN